MPIVIRKIRNKPLYSVKNALTGKIHSYGTSKKNALAQKRLLDQREGLIVSPSPK